MARKLIDITGTINDGMWNYPDPFPTLHIRPLPRTGWLAGTNIGCEIFDGFQSQTGTYLETPAHTYGNRNSYSLMDLKLEQMYEIPCVVLNVGMWDIDYHRGNRGITVEDLECCFNAKDIREGDAIILGTGWGRYWFHPDGLDYCPYVTYDAMMWLLDKKPCLIGSDTPRWDCPKNPQGHFSKFYEAGILMGAGFVNLEECTAPRCKLTILPPKFAVTCCAPARAIIIEETDD